MKLVNTSRRERGIPLAEFTILPIGGEIDVSSDEVERLKKDGSTSVALHKGWLKVLDGKAKLLPITNSETRDVPALPDGLTGRGTEYHRTGKGYFVYVNGMAANDQPVRKKEAERIAADYE